MQAVFCYSRGVTPQKVIAPWSAIPADDIDFSIRPAKGSRQVAKKVEEPWIVRMEVARAMVTKEIGELSQTLRKIGISLAVNYIDFFSGMSMVETQPVFVRRWWRRGGANRRKRRQGCNQPR